MSNINRHAFPQALAVKAALAAKVNAKLVMEKLDGQTNKRTSGTDQNVTVGQCAREKKNTHTTDRDRKD